MSELPKAYLPQESEASIYRRWEESGFFNPDKLPGRRGKPFVISMPPSNITGELHLGHALGFTIQDILVRFHRMRGRAALWLPGTDHAAIATQVVVERELKKEGLSRQKLGREKFLARVWKWKERYGSRINEQTRRLGASADWSRERFTMDPGLTLAVQEAFITLHKDGLIYRSNRIVNWCPDCQTAISDLEVDHEPTPGKLWFLRYPLSDGSGSVLVATTRPETMLGDTAVAVHPADQRYQSLVGKTVRLPIVSREIPVIADQRVEREFGTGAVKVTPAHDPLDWEIGQAAHLPVMAVIGRDGTITSEAPAAYVGLTTRAAREMVLANLRAAGALEREEEYIHSVAMCSRSKTVIEPLLSLQWFVKMKPLAERALGAVRMGKIQIVPNRYEKVFYQWLENIRDWNISRQIWWGHRLPVWYRGVGEKAEVRVAVASPGSGWVQDNDTLDTWFSSGLWTFSTLGWPKKTKDLERFHPTDVLETAWDILFFWVARMIMLSLYLKKEVPFKTVYLHGLILDREGKKMSRSKGNGIDPVEMIDRYGTDALRMSLIIGNAPGQDFRMYEEKVAGYRNFANKLWNVGRFILGQGPAPKKMAPNGLADRWILSRLAAVTDSVTKNIEGLQLSPAGQTLYDFLWHDFADWYLEWSKIEPNPAVLRHVFVTTLRLLHPFMPFITERLWTEFEPNQLLLVSPWPRVDKKRIRLVDERAFAEQQAVISRLRTFRAHASIKAEVGEVVAPADVAATWQAMSGVILRGVDRLTVGGDCVALELSGTTFHFPSAAVSRFETWRVKERGRLNGYIRTIQQKLGRDSFITNAPASVVEGERQKLAAAEAELRAID